MWGLLQSPVGSPTQLGYLCYALHRVPATASCGALYIAWVSLLSFIEACYNALWWLLQRPVLPVTQPSYLCYALHKGLLQHPVVPATASCWACTTSCTTGYQVLRSHLQ